MQLTGTELNTTAAAERNMETSRSLRIRESTVHTNTVLHKIMSTDYSVKFTPRSLAGFQ